MEDQFDNLPSKISLEKLLEYGDKALGLKVIAVCHNRAYVGVIKHILSDVKRIWLIKCFTYEGNIPIMGVLTLFYRDISFISVLNFDDEVRIKILKKTAEEVKRSKKLIMETVERTNQDDNGQVESITNGLPKNTPVQPVAPYGTCVRPELVEEICVANDIYTAAMVKINNESVVGLVVGGRSIGRKGALSWISVATPTILYHFDVLALNFQTMLDTGFRELLENPHRVKVIHDSRNFQDFLLYRHKCQLRKAFDVQLTDWYLEMRLDNGKSVCLAKNFRDIIKTHLGFQDSHFPVILERETVADSGWMERPLPDELLLESEFSASHLLEVRQVMMDEALSDLQLQTDCFVQSISRMDQYSAEITQHVMIPQEVQKMWQKNSSDRIVYTEPRAAKQFAMLE